MLKGNYILRLIISQAIIFAMVLSIFADTLRLKDGSIIKGRVTGFDGGKFTVVIGEGGRQRTLSFAADEVASIEFDSPAVAASKKIPSVRITDNSASVGNRPTSNPRVITTDTIGQKTSTRQTERNDKVDGTRTESSSPSDRTNNDVNAASVRETAEREVKENRTQPPAVEKTTPSIDVKPIELNVKVLADNTANGWTNTGWVVRKGQRIKIAGRGEVSLGQGKKTGPSGRYEIEDADKLMKAVPTGALIAVIGDDNNDFIYIGAEREFTAARDGSLFLGINEGNLNDNTGAFDAKVEIFP